MKTPELHHRHDSSQRVFSEKRSLAWFRGPSPRAQLYLFFSFRERNERGTWCVNKLFWTDGCTTQKRKYQIKLPFFYESIIFPSPSRPFVSSCPDEKYIYGGEDTRAGKLELSSSHLHPSPRFMTPTSRYARRAINEPRSDFFHFAVLAALAKSPIHHSTSMRKSNFLTSPSIRFGQGRVSSQLAISSLSAADKTSSGKSYFNLLIPNS